MFSKDFNIIGGGYAIGGNLHSSEERMKVQ